MLMNFIAFQIGWFARVLGAFAGPLAHYAGVRLGGRSSADPLATLIAVGGMWSLAIPLLLVIASRWNGVAGSDPANGALGTSATASKPA
jgi:hypothetical protein